MKLFTKCKKCKNEISFRNSSGTRVELAMNEGENIELSCKECLTKNKYLANDIYTKKSKSIEIITTFLFLVGTPLLGYIGYKKIYLSLVGTVKIASLLLISSLINSLLAQQDRRRVNTFNREYL